MHTKYQSEQRSTCVSFQTIVTSWLKPVRMVLWQRKRCWVTRRWKRETDHRQQQWRRPSLTSYIIMTRRTQPSTENPQTRISKTRTWRKRKHRVNKRLQGLPRNVDGPRRYQRVHLLRGEDRNAIVTYVSHESIDAIPSHVISASLSRSYSLALAILSVSIWIDRLCSIVAWKNCFLIQTRAW